MDAEWVNAWAAAMARASWQGAAVILLVVLFARAVPALPPAWRCWLWRGACAKLLLPLVITGAVAVPLLPAPLPTPAPARAPLPAPAVSGTVVRDAGMNGSRPESPAPPRAAAEASASHTRRLPHEIVLFAAWALGLVVHVIRLSRDHARAAALRRRATPVRDSSVLGVCRGLCERLGIRAAPPVLASHETGTPLLVGVLRPAIILPAAGLPPDDRERLRMMLAHELAHLRRRDLAWNWLPSSALALFWFHPLAWLAARELRLAQESASDALALSATGAAPRSYGAMLLDVIAAARSSPRLPRTAAAAVAETRSSVERRLTAMTRLHTTPSSRGARATLCLFAAAFGMAALVPWKLVAQTPAGAGAEAAGARSVPEGAVDAPGAPREPRAAEPQPGGAPNGAGYPGQGGYPRYGGYPGQGGYPGYGGYPGQAGQPGVGTGPGYGEPAAADPFLSEDVVQARGFVVAPEYPLSGAPGAIVSEVPAKQGQRVKKGDLLVRLDDAALRAELTAAEARFMTGQVEVRRAHELLERKNATLAEVQVAQTQLRGFEAQVELARHKLARTRVVAPVDGVVSELPARIGGAAREGHPLAVVLAVDDVSFNMDVDARTLPRLKEGQEVMVRADALPGETFDAVLTFISPQVNPGSGTAQVHARMKGGTGGLRPGLAGTAGIKAPRPQ